MATSTRVNGPMIRLMGTASICTTMGLFMKANGRTTNSMAMVLKLGLTRLAMKVATKTELKMVSATFTGTMGRATTENSVRTISVEKVSTHGVMEETIMATGRPIRCMALESSSGWMDVSMKASLLMTAKRVMVCSLGQMVVDITALGRMENKMASAISLHRMAKHKKESGKKAKSNAGLTRMAIAFRPTYLLKIRF